MVPESATRTPAGAEWEPSLAYSLYAAERDDEARQLYQELLRESPDRIDYLGALGVIAARSGERDGGLRISEVLAGLKRPYLWGDNTSWRAAIAAALGDKADAVRLLQQAFGEGNAFGVRMHRDPELQPLWDYEPFKEFVRPKG